MLKGIDELIPDGIFTGKGEDGPLFETSPREKLEKRVIAQAVLEALNGFEEYNELRAGALDENRDFRLSVAVVIRNGYDRVSACVSGSMKFQVEKTLDFEGDNQMEFDFYGIGDGEGGTHGLRA